MTLEELKEKLEEILNSDDETAERLTELWALESGKEVFNGLEIEAIKNQVINGDMEVVFKIGDKFYQAYINYSSWDSPDYSEVLENIKEVSPKEKVVYE